MSENSETGPEKIYADIAPNIEDGLIVCTIDAEKEEGHIEYLRFDIASRLLCERFPDREAKLIACAFKAGMQNSGALKPENMDDANINSMFSSEIYLKAGLEKFKWS